jgi:hypothetical protein
LQDAISNYFVRIGVSGNYIYSLEISQGLYSGNIDMQ